MDPMKSVVSEGVATLRRVISRYPLDSALDAELRSSFVQYLGGDASSGGRRLTPDHIMVTRGSDAGLRTIFRAFAMVRPEASVSVLTPTYQAVFGMLAAAGVGSDRVVRVPCTRDAEVQSALDRSATSSSLVYLCNPNNPLGYVADRDSIRCAVEASPGTLFVVDEAYIDYADEPHRQSVACTTPVIPNLLVTRSFSKAFGLAGARLGVVVGHPDTLATLRRLMCPTEVADTSKAMGIACLSPAILPVFQRHFARVRHLRAWAVDTLRKRLMMRDGEQKEHAASVRGLVDVLDGGGMFFAVHVADAVVSKRLVAYLDAIWDVVVARRGGDPDMEEGPGAPLHHCHHVVRCQIGDAATTRTVVCGVAAFFGRPISLPPTDQITPTKQHQPNNTNPCVGSV